MKTESKKAAVVRERARLREQRHNGAGCVMVGAGNAIVAGDRRRAGSLG